MQEFPMAVQEKVVQEEREWVLALNALPVIAWHQAVKVGTFSFQPRGFYEKCGNTGGGLPGPSPGSAEYWLRKDL